MSAPRHTRQSRLVEVGGAGQARIRASTLSVCTDGLAGEVHARYLAGAGVGTLRVHDEAAARAAREVDGAVRIEEGLSVSACTRPPFDVRDPVARQVATGSYFALVAIAGALRTGGSHDPA